MDISGHNGSYLNQFGRYRLRQKVGHLWSPLTFDRSDKKIGHMDCDPQMEGFKNIYCEVDIDFGDFWWKVSFSYPV